MRTLSRFLILMVLLLAAACQKDEVAPPALSSEDTEKVAFRDFTAEQLYAILDAMETEINAWMDAGELNANTGDRLLDKVSIMRSLVDDGRLSSAERALSRSFLQYVNRLYEEGRLTGAQNRLLEDFTQGILYEGTVSDGTHTYRWKRMADGRRWLVENLRYTIPDDPAKNIKSWLYPSWRYPYGIPYQPDLFGRLYNWHAAVASCEVLGDGWRLPANEDWDTLGSLYGEWITDNWNDEAYENLVAILYDWEGNGSSGFDALLGGLREGHFSDRFVFLNSIGIYWSATEANANSAWYFQFEKMYDMLYFRGPNNKALYGFSCRCVHD